MFRKPSLLITLVVLLFGTIVTGLAIYGSANAVSYISPPREIHITAKNYEFDPGTITLKKGVPVVFVITSPDRKHGIKVRGLGIRADVEPGKVTRVVFTPDKTGEFPFTCDVFCGDGHEDMTGTVVVKE